MSTIRELIAARLGASPDLAGLVGDRIYPRGGVKPNAQPPCVVWWLDGGGPLNASDGATGTFNRKLIVKSIGQTDAEATAVAKAVLGSAALRRGLDGWRDQSQPLSIGSCILLTEQDDPEPKQDGSNEMVPAVSQEFSVWYAEE